jgi:multimeric flavodoxin WrbA/membrane protease YdiL (CAAX protease family)
MISAYKYKPVLYFSVTILVTFALWFAGAYASFQDDTSGLYMIFMIAGGMAPFLISLGMTIASKDPELKKNFINRLSNFKLIEPKALPVLFLLMPLTILISIVLSLPLGESISQFRFSEGFSFSSGFVPVLLFLMLAAGFEELGWRGYAFDSLQGRFNYLKASIVFSILWSLWHFPQVFVKNSYQYEIFQQNVWFGVNFFVSMIPMGIIISWFCARNRKSVIAAILFHFIINICQEILEITQITKCIETAVLTVVAVAIVLLDKQVFVTKARSRGAEEEFRKEGANMKVIGIISSPHFKGNGATLVREALQGAEEAGASVQEVFLPTYRIEYCRDCRACMITGRCAVQDDFPKLRELLREADGIILSSPAYGPGVCARMKNLMDRLGQYAFLTSTFGGKYVIGLATAGSFGAAKAARQLASSFRDSVFRRAYVTGTFGVLLRGRHVSAMPRELLKARKLGRKMALDIQSSRRFPLQNLVGRLPNALFLRPLIKQAILQNKDAMRGVYEELIRSGIVARKNEQAA